MIAFGPIPSRRLGKSLGINNISGLKTCTYSCVYCQVGARCRMTDTRQTFYAPEVLNKEVNHHYSLLQAGDKPDFLTFVANGEPTLDQNLGREIKQLHSLGIPVAVISNASLLSDPEVRKNLSLADWVSVKVDAGDESTRERINRPLPSLRFEKYMEGLLEFRKMYTGTLVTETMLADGFNDNEEQLEMTAKLVSMLNPETAYIAIPTRPPAVSSVRPPAHQRLIQAYDLFTKTGVHTELIIGFEGTAFSHTGNVRNDLLYILAVHPLREDAIQVLLRKNNSDWSVVGELIRENLIRKVNYRNYTYYLRQYSGN